MKRTEYAVRLFLAIAAFQLAFLFVDTFNVFMDLSAGEKYVFHFLSRYTAPIAYGFGSLHHLTEYLTAMNARREFLIFNISHPDTERRSMFPKPI